MPDSETEVRMIAAIDGCFVAKESKVCILLETRSRERLFRWVGGRRLRWTLTLW